MSLIEPGTSDSGTQPSHRLHWSRGPDGGANRLCDVLRDPAAARGVGGIYVIWHETAGGRRWLYVGEDNDIADRLAEHGYDPQMQAHDGSRHELRVSWAAVAALHRQGILCYLAQALVPLVAAPMPAARALRVNLPG